MNYKYFYSIFILVTIKFGTVIDNNFVYKNFVYKNFVYKKMALIVNLA